jgi:hypothetical protein
MSKFRAYLDRQQPLQVTDHLPVEGSKSRFFVTIPCFDEPELVSALNSLAGCNPPSSNVTIVVVVNSPENSPPEVLARNLQTIDSVKTWWKSLPNSFFQLRLLHAPALPAKWAGVGWARKIAMDQAISSLDLKEEDDGILVAFDADSVVSPNYFTAIEAAFRDHPQYNFVNLNFCHPVDDPDLDPYLREGIILYELYLRYLKNAMQWTGYPHAIHTVGSSFAVKASAYVKQGGMNRRKAGEDFHFLHKIVLLGDYGQVTDATVYPAARTSHRVPFGTGAALRKWEQGDQELHSAYSIKSIESLRQFFDDPGYFYRVDHADWENRLSKLDPNLYSYLIRTGTPDRLNELKSNCADVKNFVKRFYHQANAFWIIQYLNVCESIPGGRGDLVQESSKLLTEFNIEIPVGISPRELLEIYRKLDKRST